ncbi:unnamed protein product [Chondrus crispus]|uniref:Uncharacterized protein n=1 Tax=Chondrus crispus TaxID=2769 RepID=R7QPE4_CHOCR|nr:unnamed protein product [Chondrus crispus]CDF40362.1 unnamed protein product [Chondrus crispus]|eukprot:XP_005710656.1 unnamed protein product [Chondrus crispus]
MDGAFDCNRERKRLRAEPHRQRGRRAVLHSPAVLSLCGTGVVWNEGEVERRRARRPRKRPALSLCRRSGGRGLPPVPVHSGGEVERRGRRRRVTGILQGRWRVAEVRRDAGRERGYAAECVEEEFFKQGQRWIAAPELGSGWGGMPFWVRRPWRWLEKFL